MDVFVVSDTLIIETDALHQHGQVRLLKPQLYVLGHRTAHQPTHSMRHQVRGMLQAFKPRVDLRSG